MTQSVPLLEVRNIRKTFPGGVVANDGVSFTVNEGDIHGLLGENGAGKSTLMKIIYGLYEQDDGEILLWGTPLDIDRPKDSIEAGIGMVHQDFKLIPRLTVTENVILGENRIDDRRNDADSRGPAGAFINRLLGSLTLDTTTAHNRILELMESYGIDIDPDSNVWELSVGEQQRVEILKALYRDVDLLILDEPTSALTPDGVEQLFSTLQELVNEGMTVIFITHKLHEIKSVADRVTILREGSVIETARVEDVSRADLARMMVGREVLFDIQRDTLTRGASLLEVSDLRAINDRGIESLRGVDFELAAGEIIGIAGVSGNGQEELVDCLTGLQRPAAGSISLKNKQLTGQPPRAFVKAGVAHIPADALKYGCAPGQSVLNNLLLKEYSRFSEGSTFQWGKAREFAEELVEQFDIRVPNVDTDVSKLSGGNRQKLILARELASDPLIIIANQPTRGLDVGAVEYVRETLISQLKDGSGILLVSEELDEVLQVSDRIFVMHEGKIVHKTTRENADRDMISRAMTGDTDDESFEATVKAKPDEQVFGDGGE